jgi:hypothetical protein
MNIWQDSLVQLGQKIFSNRAETERLESNFKFVKTLVSALQEPNAYFYKFDRLKVISILESPDENFRLFSWNIQLMDGSYLYYGAIQHKMAGGKLKLTPLLDKTFEITDPERDIVSNDVWYGAQYYDIIALSDRQYALLGWKGHHPEYTQKVIDILNINADGSVNLGAPVFSDNPVAVRKIFAYNRSATMYLSYNADLRRIEFDHIVPVRPEFEGQFKYYGPDLTHDSYKVEAGKLILQEAIELSNPESGEEGHYIDPKHPNRKLKSGL